MDDLKFYGKSEIEIHALANIIRNHQDGSLQNWAFYSWIIGIDKLGVFFTNHIFKEREHY